LPSLLMFDLCTSRRAESLTRDKIRAYPMARRGDLLVCWPEELKLRTNGGP
jgi:hypothetical protein